MKKLLAMLMAVTLLASLCVIAVSAEEEPEYVQYGTLYEFPAVNNDEIMDWEAGEKSIKWSVPYQSITPTLDGQIKAGEYPEIAHMEDYINVMVTNYTLEESIAFYNKIKEGFFSAGWCWDGEYLYMGFEVDCLEGYECNPENDVMLFAENCLQVGLASPDCEGKDDTYCELGFGYNPEDGRNITTSWAGNYNFSKDDLACSYDEAAQRVVYELRIHLQTAMGLVDRTVQNGDEWNMGLVWEMSGADGDNSKAMQVAFCHGIGGQFGSAKSPQYFARISFEGLPADVDVPITEIEQVSGEDKEYGLAEQIMFSKEEVVSSFTAVGSKIEMMTEGEETFARITVSEDGAYLFSNTYPRRLLSENRYLVIKYRTSSEQFDELGLLWKARGIIEEYNLDECYFDYLETDGNWNYLLIDMNSEGTWADYIVNLGLVPGHDAEGIAGGTLDIAWIKCYLEDPYDLYEQYMPTEEPTTKAPTTEAPTTEAQTQAPAGNEGTTEGETSKGCGGVVGAGVIAIVAMLGTAIVVKKKD